MEKKILTAINNYKRSDDDYLSDTYDKYVRQVTQEIMKKPLFERTTLGLYDNPETENWITTSFADRYHPSHAPEFKVNWIQLMNEGGQSYIEVSLFFPEDVEFLVNNTAIV